MPHAYLSYVPAFPKPSQVKRELPHVKVFPGAGRSARRAWITRKGPRAAPSTNAARRPCGSVRRVSAASTGSCLLSR